MKYEDLKIRNGWSLSQKIDHTVGVIDSFLAKTDGKAYISFMAYENNGVAYREALEYIGIKLPDGRNREMSLFGMNDFITY
jgi:hypothetical protein